MALSKPPVANEPPVVSEPRAEPTPPAGAEPGGPPPTAQVPGFVRILEQTRPGDAQVTVATPDRRTLELTTRNVQRMRLTRLGLPLQADTIVLRIDGYGIEWRPNRAVVEVERTNAGVWVVASRPAETP